MLLPLFFYNKQRAKMIGLGDLFVEIENNPNIFFDF
jgi:hypothetical protein